MFGRPDPLDSVAVVFEVPVVVGVEFVVVPELADDAEPDDPDPEPDPDPDPLLDPCTTTVPCMNGWIEQM